MSESTAIRQLFEQRERDFLMGKSRVTMRASVENLEAGDVKLGTLREGESVDLPRWVAEELVQRNVAVTTEEPFETEIFKALSREKMMGPFQLSALGQDFYIKMRRRLGYLAAAAKEGKVRREDTDRLRASCYDLIGIRLGKLLSLSSSATNVANIADKLTPEEKAFFTTSQSMSKEWRRALLGEAQ